MKKAICIIDDDPIYQFLMKKIINSSTIETSLFSFCNGFDAIENFKIQLENNLRLPDIILLDIEMPVMNGWDFMREMESLLKNKKIGKTKIYVVSSSISYEDIQTSNLFENVAGYYSKPITKTTLHSILEDNEIIN